MEKETIEKLSKQLKDKTRELEEAHRTNTKLSNEVTKLTRFNKDLISQIDLTNSKLHLLLGVCEGRVDKSIQTDLVVNEIGKCSHCQTVSSSSSTINTHLTSSSGINSTDNKQLKAADWARIAQEVVDSNDYIYEPTSKTYYSQSSGWYYYPNEKLFFDPKSTKYYTYNQTTKSYEHYAVEPIESSKESKKPKKLEKTESEEEGELSSSNSESDDDEDDEPSSDIDCDKSKIFKPREDDPEEYDYPSDDESNVSCLRMIVRESESLKLGSLLLITITGALIGNSPDCDLTITDPSVSRKHARISYDTKKRCYQIVDCSSKHGVFLNNRRLKVDIMEPIKHGDILKLAKSEFLLHHHYGNKVTCNGCEPGCVQAELLLAGKLVNEDEDPIIVVEDRHTALKKMKKRYGVTWNEENRVNLPTNYRDRAQKRRSEKGSDNPYEKTGEGTSLDKPLNNDNKGFKMLKKMGWSKGQGIGKNMAGDTQPLPLVSTEGRTGLGFDHS